MRIFKRNRLEKQVSVKNQTFMKNLILLFVTAFMVAIAPRTINAGGFDDYCKINYQCSEGDFLKSAQFDGSTCQVEIGVVQQLHVVIDAEVTGYYPYKFFCNCLINMSKDPTDIQKAIVDACEKDSDEIYKNVSEKIKTICSPNSGKPGFGLDVYLCGKSFYNDLWATVYDDMKSKFAPGNPYQYFTGVCGDGHPNLGEDCDLGKANGNLASTCSNDCKIKKATTGSINPGRKRIDGLGGSSAPIDVTR